MRIYFFLYVFLCFFIKESISMPPKENKPNTYNNNCFKCLSDGYNYCKTNSNCLYPWNQTLCGLPLI